MSPCTEPMSPTNKKSLKLKILGLLCNQTDSKTLYYSVLKLKYSRSILKHKKGKMKYASLNNSHNNCHRNYMNEIFLQRGPAGASHVARVNFKTSRVGVYKCLSRRLCRHCRNLAEGGCLLSRFHFRRCRYFLGHVACWNLPWQGLYKYTGSDQSIVLCILRDSCHELFSIVGDFYVSGTQDAEVTKSLISLFSVHVNYFVPASIVS